MKIQCTGRHSDRGSILVVTLIIAMVIGISLGSYLTLAELQSKSVARSQRWNAALDMAEAGVEEALAQMNSSVSIQMSGAPSDFSGNTWGQSASGVFGPQTRTLVNGSYNVLISTNPVPTVYSTGYVTVPFSTATVKRVVEVTAQTLPLLNVALGAVGNINMNGNSMATDSWNSHDSSLSNNGQFDSGRISTNGNVASVQGLVNIGNHTIDGNLYLGPTASYLSSTNQVLDKIYNDYNVQFPNASLPQNTTWQSPPSDNGRHDFRPEDSGGTFWINDSSPIIIEPGVKVTLKVTTTSFSPSSITIEGGMTNSGTLTIYQVSGSASLSGNSIAGGNRPENFYYFGLPGVTSISLGGTTEFVGVIYAPQATLSLNGGGNADNLVGSAIVGNASLNGHYNVHYDEALMTNGPTRGFVATSWQEL